MDLQEHVMWIIDTNWTTSRELAVIIAQKYPEEFKKPPYSGVIPALSMALGPALYALSKQGRIEHDGTKWPATKRWRRVGPKEGISVDNAAEALMKLHSAADKNQAIRMLAARTIREHKDEFRVLIQDASRVSEESMKIRKRMLGIEKEE